MVLIKSFQESQSYHHHSLSGVNFGGQLRVTGRPHVGMKGTHTHTHMQWSPSSYPSLAVRQRSSPSWHSSTLVKPDSSTGSSGAGSGGAGAVEQLPQHSPSAEPSLRLLASRANPGRRRGRLIRKNKKKQTFSPKSSAEDRAMPRSPSLVSLVQVSVTYQRASVSPRQPARAPSSPASNFRSHVSHNIPCLFHPTPLPGFGEERD